MPERLIVTSALPYANGPIHFGHLVGAYLPADVYVRFRRMLGDDVHYVCGTDEHGVAITLKAEQAGEPYEQYVDKWHDVIKAKLDRLGIEFDIFTGTAHHRNPFHREISQQFFLDLLANDYLIERTEEQFYSTKSERFLPDRYVEGTCYLCSYEHARGDECPNCGKYLDAKKLIAPRSSLDGSEPLLRETKHWYLDLGKARDTWLREWFESKTDWKPNVRNFVLGDLAELRERPITRDLPWGVPLPVPDTAGKVLYVWFDAPIGYLSISRQYFEQQGRGDEFEKLWQDPTTKLYHFIGKDNITFHAVVFPTMLRGTGRGWVIPENVPANEFFNLQGDKFNTSKGWFIPDDSCVKDVPVDALRYALCTMMPETADSEWTWEEFQSRVNNDLADNLGNFVSRTLRFVERFFDGVVPAAESLGAEDEELLAAAANASAEFQEHLHAFSFRKACQSLMVLGNACNQFYDSEEPWAKIKAGDAGRIRAGCTMRLCVEMIHALAVLCRPIMPDTSRTLLAALGVDAAPGFDGVGRLALPAGPLEGLPLTGALPKHTDDKGREKTALFRKIPDAAVAAELERLKQMAENAERPDAPAHDPIADGIEFDDFVKVDLRAGTIVEAEKHPKADRLLVLQVDLGFERRTLVAGIAASYAPEELQGQRCIVVANLAPRKLRGITSQGMVLATDDADGKPHIVQPDAATPDGARVK